MSSHHRPLLFFPFLPCMRLIPARARSRLIHPRLFLDCRSYRICIFQRRTATAHKVAPELMAESFARFASFGDFFDNPISGNVTARGGNSLRFYAVRGKFACLCARDVYSRRLELFPPRSSDYRFCLIYLFIIVIVIIIVVVVGFFPVRSLAIFEKYCRINKNAKP